MSVPANLTRPATRFSPLRWRESGVVGVLAIEILLFALLVHRSTGDWSFVQRDNLLTILAQAAIIGITAVGVAVVIISGGIDLSVGGLIALTSVVVAGLMRAGVNVPSAIAITLGTGLLSGALAALLVTFADLPPFIATLALMLITRGAAFVLTEGQTWRVTTAPGFTERFGNDVFVGIPWAALLLLGVALFTGWLLVRTAWGRQVFAVGGNETAARYAGVHVARIKWSVYLLSGMLAALAGTVYTAKYGSGTSGAATGYELDAVAAAVVGGASLAGGRGSVIGAMLGAVIFATLRTGLSQVTGASAYQNVIVGCVVVLAVVSDRAIQRRVVRH